MLSSECVGAMSRLLNKREFPISKTVWRVGLAGIEELREHSFIIQMVIWLDKCPMSVKQNECPHDITSSSSSLLFLKLLSYNASYVLVAYLALYTPILFVEECVLVQGEERGI